MTGLNHGITGAAIAVIVKEPILAIPLSFLSHFVMDLIPHFGLPERDLFKRKFNLILIADFMLSVILMVILAAMFPQQMWLIWVCMVAAASPDLMWAYYRLYMERIKKLKPRYDPLAKVHHLLQWSQSTSGAYVETMWFLLVGSYILLLR